MSFSTEKNRLSSKIAQPRGLALVSTLAAVLFLAVAPPVSAQIPIQEFADRRAALLESAEDGVILALGSREPIPDFLPYHRSSPFFYLTGLLEPGAALVMIKDGERREQLLFVRASDPAQEVWTGPRVGVPNVRARLGIEGRDVALLNNALDSILRIQPKLHVIGDIGRRVTERSPDEQFIDALVKNNEAITVQDIRRNVDRLRATKSPAELERIKIAAEISARGHLAAMRSIVPDMGEFEIQAIAEFTWRREGGDGPSYNSIVGSGPNSTTLHYGRNSRIARAGEVIVMDMATFYDGYAADITRTVPVSGKFSPEQREIYTVVLEAQKAAERQVKIGGHPRAMIDSSNAVMKEGLAKLGLIDSPDATYDCGNPAQPRQCPQLSLYYMHGLGHGIGLDVHDPEQYTYTMRIDAGSVFTIEPGIYVRENLIDIIIDTPRNSELKARIAAAVRRYANIGVRIEDDYMVTAEGVTRISAGVPREIDEIEREMALPRPPRDATVVERYQLFKTGWY